VRLPCLLPGTLCSGTCTNLQTDEDNCGSCGNVCPAGASCSGGTCACPAGYYLFNNVCRPEVVVPSSAVKNVLCASPTTLCDGTCTNLQTDKDNCGSCGNTCPTNGGYCSGGICYCPKFYVNYNGVCLLKSSVSWGKT